jgi:hypothetical protein
MDSLQILKQIQYQAMKQVDRHVKDPIWRRVGRQAGISAEDCVGNQVFGGCVAMGWFQDRVGNQAQEDNDGYCES